MVVTPSGHCGVCAVPLVVLEPKHAVETVPLLQEERVEKIATVIFQKFELAMKFTVHLVST